MTFLSYSSGVAHENGDCWAPTCPACELEESTLLTCESCEEVSYEVAACDHLALCPDCRGDNGCRECRAEMRADGGRTR